MTIQSLIRINAPRGLDGHSAAIGATSDHALIERIAASDRFAMRALFLRHQVRVYRFVLRLVGNPQAAEDLVSEVFLDIWRHAAKFQARSQVSTWILAIARLKAFSSLRRRDDDEWDDGMAAAIVDPGDDPEVAIQKKQRSDVLRQCLSRLSPQHREIIDLAYYHEMTIRDVAEIVDIPENTAKTRMFHARKRLSELLSAAGVDRSWIVEAGESNSKEAARHVLRISPPQS
jgi:RNA polymerase sigma-70 factor (ECF subfamily)